jgi:hypothetical protein
MSSSVDVAALVKDPATLTSMLQSAAFNELDRRSESEDLIKPITHRTGAYVLLYSSVEQLLLDSTGCSRRPDKFVFMENENLAKFLSPTGLDVPNISYDCNEEAVVLALVAGVDRGDEGFFSAGFVWTPLSKDELEKKKQDAAHPPPASSAGAVSTIVGAPGERRAKKRDRDA